MIKSKKEQSEKNRMQNYKLLPHNTYVCKYSYLFKLTFIFYVNTHIYIEKRLEIKTPFY